MEKSAVKCNNLKGEVSLQPEESLHQHFATLATLHSTPLLLQRKFGQEKIVNSNIFYKNI